MLRNGKNKTRSYGVYQPKIDNQESTNLPTRRFMT